MPVNAREADDGKSLMLTVEGAFDFRVYDDFRTAYERSGATHVVVDVGSVRSIDSSALGLLVLLREHAGGPEATIEIVSACTRTRAMLETAVRAGWLSVR